VSGRVKDAGCR